MSKNAAFKFFSFSGKSDKPASPQNVPDQRAASLAPEAPDVANVRDEALGAALDLFENDVLRIVRTMTDGISSAQDKSMLASNRLSDVQSSIDALVGSSAQVQDEVSGIAQSTDELTLAANEITHTVELVRERSNATMQSAADSARDIEGVGTAVGEIGISGVRHPSPR